MFSNLATELVYQVLLSCNSIQDAHSLSSTCKRFHAIYASSQKLIILERVAETEYGPLQDIIQLITHNSSQPAHIKRNVSFSLTLVKQIARVGLVAQQWIDIYPFKRWKENFEDRRLLTPAEQYNFRRALYRLWLYSRAFHNKSYPRTSRMQHPTVMKRTALLHNWSTPELAEIADVHAVMLQVVSANVCPSDGTIARKYRKRFPDREAHQLLFNIHLNYNTGRTSGPNSRSSSPCPQQYKCPEKHVNAKYAPTRQHEIGLEGWGDDINHYYVVQDMLKLDPAQILYLKERAPLKRQVERYVRNLGNSLGSGTVSFEVDAEDCVNGEGEDWFDNNGETWVQTLEWVLEERGEDLDEFFGLLAEGKSGIVTV